MIVGVGVGVDTSRPCIPETVWATLIDATTAGCSPKVIAREKETRPSGPMPTRQMAHTSTTARVRRGTHCHQAHGAVDGGAQAGGVAVALAVQRWGKNGIKRGVGGGGSR